MRLKSLWEAAFAYEKQISPKFWTRTLSRTILCVLFGSVFFAAVVCYTGPVAQQSGLTATLCSVHAVMFAIQGSMRCCIWPCLYLRRNSHSRFLLETKVGPVLIAIAFYLAMIVILHCWDTTFENRTDWVTSLCLHCGFGMYVQFPQLHETMLRRRATQRILEGLGVPGQPDETEVDFDFENQPLTEPCTTLSRWKLWATSPLPDPLMSLVAGYTNWVEWNHLQSLDFELDGTITVVVGGEGSAEKIQCSHVSLDLCHEIPRYLKNGIQMDLLVVTETQDFLSMRQSCF
jgi:hypothetical protein